MQQHASSAELAAETSILRQALQRQQQQALQQQQQLQQLQQLLLLLRLQGTCMPGMLGTPPFTAMPPAGAGSWHATCLLGSSADAGSTGCTALGPVAA